MRCWPVRTVGCTVCAVPCMSGVGRLIASTPRSLQQQNNKLNAAGSSPFSMCCCCTHAPLQATTAWLSYSVCCGGPALYPSAKNAGCCGMLLMPTFSMCCCCPAGDYGLGSLSLLEGPSLTSFFPDITLAGQKVGRACQAQTSTAACTALLSLLLNVEAPFFGVCCLSRPHRLLTAGRLATLVNPASTLLPPHLLLRAGQ